MERANLTARFPVGPGRCQVVFCRNVLIYLSRTAADSFLDRLADWLAPDGLVFLGYSEAVLAPTPRLRVQRLGPAHALRVVPGTTHGPVPGKLPGGLWTTASPEPGGGLRSPTGGPGTGSPGSKAPTGPPTASAGASRPTTAAEMAQAGELAARLGNHAEAVAAFRKSVFLDPDHPVAWFQLGVALGAVQDRRGARRAYAAALAALERCDQAAVRAGLDGWAADELAGVLRARLGRP